MGFVGLVNGVLCVLKQVNTLNKFESALQTFTLVYTCLHASHLGPMRPRAAATVDCNTNFYISTYIPFGRTAGVQGKLLGPAKAASLCSIVRSEP